MEQQSSEDSTWLTPSQVAKQLQIDVSKVLTWIHNGELRAVNVAERLNGRPRWRISPTALEGFLRRRESSPPPLRTYRREYTRSDRCGQVVREDDGRLAKNIPHEVRVQRMAKLMAASKFGYGAEWRPYVQRAVARYAERTGVTVEPEAVLAIED